MGTAKKENEKKKLMDTRINFFFLGDFVAYIQLKKPH